ncbi:hypothetical protein [Oscillatoria sp. HE19RPO]|uniref:hypothetical protein n=1 Tax=Oscillatoria sp. HE19RPO TaxID=2954806 RepID=UPI0020C43DB6|nr:hypothetical protein [Oscillatoria sp. HE19RPO]
MEESTASPEGWVLPGPLNPGILDFCPQILGPQCLLPSGDRLIPKWVFSPLML